MEPEIDIDCACASVRRTARLITKLYARQLGKALEPTQFSLLSLLDRMPGRGQSVLAKALGLDKTTLSRNLTLIQKRGWIEPVSGDDLRERGYRLTVRGSRLLAKTRPGWQNAQDDLRAAMTPAEWQAMMTAFRVAARAARSVGLD
jgi:DNA-binding MarR family transcriptional regulator